MSDNAFCFKCKKRKDCTSICEELEKILPKPHTGRLRKGEFSFDPHILDKIVLKDRGKGRRKEPYIYGDTWDLT